MNDNKFNGAGGEQLIGIKQQKMKMHPVMAVAKMSEGFLLIMQFIQGCGMPKDVMIEAMRRAEAYGLCRRIDGTNPNGTVYMQYINPYADMAEKLTAEQRQVKPVTDEKKEG